MGCYSDLRGGFYRKFLYNVAIQNGISRTTVEWLNWSLCWIWLSRFLEHLTANELILQYPEYLDALNRYGWSPLMQACREGHFECVKLLLQNGADPSICNLLGVNALTIATRGGYEKIVNLLFEHDVYLSKGISRIKSVRHISRNQKLLVVLLWSYFTLK